MHKNTQIQPRARLKKRKELRRIQVPIVDVGTDFHPHQTQRRKSFQLLNGQLRILQRNGTQPVESIRVTRHHLRHVVVQKPRNLQVVLRLGPVVKEYRHGRQDLTMHPVHRAFAQPNLRIPAIVLNFPEKAIVHHHPGTTGAVVVQGNKSAVAKSLSPRRESLRQNMGVNINEHATRRYVSLLLSRISL